MGDLHHRSTRKTGLFKSRRGETRNPPCEAADETEAEPLRKGRPGTFNGGGDSEGADSKIVVGRLRELKDSYSYDL